MTISDLVNRYIADDDLAVDQAAASNSTVERILYLQLMSSAEDGTLSDDWSDLYTPDELSFLINALSE